MLEKLPRRQRCDIHKALVLIPGLFLLLVALGSQSTRAQESTTHTEFWPEIDVYIHVKPKVSLFFLGTVSNSVEDGEIRNAQA